jgi:hypothetical protein
MAVDIKALIADKTNFADTVVVTVGNQQMTLGEIRSLATETQNAINKRETELNQRQQQLEKGLRDLGIAQTTTAELYAQVQQEKAGLGNNTNRPAANEPDPLDALEKDNILGPLVRTLRSETAATKAALEAERKSREEITKGMQMIAQTYLNDKLGETYEATVPEAKRVALPIEQLIQYGMTQGYKTRGGYVDIKRAYNELTANDRAAATETELRDKITKEVTADLMSKGIVVRAPSAMGGGLPSFESPAGPGANNSGQQAFKSLDAAFEAAAKDANLWREFNGLPQA